MKVLVILALAGLAAANQSSHTEITRGHGHHGASHVAHGTHRAHGSHHAVAHQAAHSKGPYQAPTYTSSAAYHPADPVYHARPSYHAAPTYHAAPSYHRPAYRAPHAAPAYHAAPSHPRPSYHASPKGYGNQYHEPANYQFAYAVKDDYSGNDFGHEEARNGYDTTGTYYVLLPDGRRQTVTYKADDYGYNAEVSYYGEAKYDHAPAPSYHKPSYAPRPAYGHH